MKYLINFIPEINATFNIPYEMLKTFLNGGYSISQITAEGYVINRPANGTIAEIDDNGIVRGICNPCEFIMHRYNKKQVTKEDFDRLVIDLERNDITFDDILSYR